MLIRELRKSLNMSQEAFATCLGLMTKGTVSKIETKNAASPEIAIKIANLSGGRITAEEISPKLAEIARLKAQADSP